MSDEPWRPKAGELVQIWDHLGVKEADLASGWIQGHGKVGYVVKRYSDHPDIWKVVCFGDEGGVYHDVWYGWLRPINKTTDIKKV